MKEQDYDVIVYGAGIGGVAAAVAAAESSRRTLLADAGPDVGGPLVCGLVNHWRGEASSRFSEFMGPLTRRAWGKLLFEPEELAGALRKRLDAAGVDLMLNSGMAKVKQKGGRIRSALFGGGYGKVKLSAWCWVDASEDYALARLTGCEFEGAGRRVTLLARIGGIDMRAPGVFDAEALRGHLTEFFEERTAGDLPDWLGLPSLSPCLRGGTAILDCSRGGLAVGDGALDMTKAEGLLREGAQASLGFLQRNVPGYENCHMISFAAQPLILEVPLPVRLRAGLAASGSELQEPAECNMDCITDSTEAAEDVVALRYRGPDSPEREFEARLGHLMTAGAANLLLARAEGMGADCAAALADCGHAAGSAAAEAVLYDGFVPKLEPERLAKVFLA